MGSTSGHRPALKRLITSFSRERESPTKETGLYMVNLHSLAYNSGSRPLVFILLPCRYGKQQCTAVRCFEYRLRQ